VQQKLFARGHFPAQLVEEVFEEEMWLCASDAAAGMNTRIRLPSGARL